MSRMGCGETKGCLFKPAGCDPALDCTIALIFFVDGPNSLRIEMMAQSLIPPPPLQYIAIGFSNDDSMGDDMVSECVLSTNSEFAEAEVFLSNNIPNNRGNNRIYLTEEERKTLFHNVTGEVVDGRLYCQFSQQIIAQIDERDRIIRDLDHKYFILGATGSAQPNELNAHDTSRDSLFYPIVSDTAINPSRTGQQQFDLPPHFGAPPTESPQQINTLTSSVSSRCLIFSAVIVLLAVFISFA
ncbi:Putative ferric-chelate reductase 1 -like protein [Toxocara canis]|nr:Putative ferric-chelate reductase 1 -like protein [Toxocara canis]